MTVYADGVKLGENAALGATIEQLGTDLVGYLGKSLYSGDGYFQGWYDNVRVYNRALSATEVLANAGVTDQLLDVSLTDASVLKLAPIVTGAAHTAVFPVNKGTDVTALAPTFTTAPGVTVSPASGTVVDLTQPVTYTLTAPGGHDHDVDDEGDRRQQPRAARPLRRSEHRGLRRHVLHLRDLRRLRRLGRQGVLRLELEEPRGLGALGRAVPDPRRCERQRAVGDGQRLGADDHRARREVLLLLQRPQRGAQPQDDRRRGRRQP